MAKTGFVEALYVGEFVGIILIFTGYLVCLKDTQPSESIVEISKSARSHEALRTDR